MSTATALKPRIQDADPNSNRVGMQYRLIFFRERAHAFGSASSISVGMAVDLGSLGRGVCRSIERVSAHHVEADMGALGTIEIPDAAIAVALLLSDSPKPAA